MESGKEAQQFGQLRARIEATFREPTMIVVSSAARGDGKSVTAFGLAAALAEADHRVLLVDANASSPTLTSTQHRPISGSRLDLAQVSSFAAPVAGERFKGVSFADERLESGMSMEKMKSAVVDMQSHFDFTIVDTGQLIKSNLAVLFATIADGTMLTLRLGRYATTDDEETIKTLTRASANVLGALSLTPKLIKGFHDRVVSADRGLRVPIGRHVTSRHSLDPELVREVTADGPSRSKFVS